jgi:tetratricopeptide (TPR) repeat protein
VFWVDVSTPAAAQNAFITIAQTLGSSCDNLSEACQILGSTDKTWFLILDNADEHTVDYQAYMPPGTRGTIIMTSRNLSCERYSTVGHCRLQGIDLESSITLLFKAANVSERSESQKSHARVVSELLGFHALALIQAGAYIAKGHCTLEEYPEVFQRHRTRLLQFRPDQEQSRYRDVHTTFEASADILSRSGQPGIDALQLLGILSKVHYSPFPCALFELAWQDSQHLTRYHTYLPSPEINSDPYHAVNKRGKIRDSRFVRKILTSRAIRRSASTVEPAFPSDSTSTRGRLDLDSLSRDHVSQLPHFIPVTSKKWDSFRFNESVNLLASLSLVNVAKGQSMNLSMHPLAHAWAQDRQNLEDQVESWIRAGCILAMSIDMGPDFWIVHQMQLRSHLLAFLNVDIYAALSCSSPIPVIPIVLHCAGGLINIVETDRLQQVLKDIFAFLSLNPDRPVEEHVEIYTVRCWLLLDLGEHKQALSLLDQVYTIHKKIHAETHPNRRWSQNLLANVYMRERFTARAIALFEDLVRIEHTILEETDPVRLSTLRGLATAYHKDGQIRRAIELLEDLVSVKSTLPNTHPDRLLLHSALAKAYLDVGQVSRSIELLDRVVAIHTTLPKTDPSRLESQHELARAVLADGQVSRAIELLENVVELQATLPKAHPNRLVSQHELARAYLADGQVSRAIELFEHVVELRTMLPEAHIVRLTSQYNLASAYSQDGQKARAIELLEHVVRIQRATLLETDPWRIESETLLQCIQEEAGMA